jgi:hypothetical protein
VRRTGPLACLLLNIVLKKHTTSHYNDGTLQKMLLVVVQFLVVVLV